MSDLEIACKNYLFYFESTETPVVAFFGGDPTPAVSLAKVIYDGEDMWFWTNARVINVMGTHVSEMYPDIELIDDLVGEYVDIIKIPGMDKLEIAVLTRAKMVWIDENVSKIDKSRMIMFGYLLVHESADAQIWVRQK